MPRAGRVKRRGDALVGKLLGPWQSATVAERTDEIKNNECAAAGALTGARLPARADGVPDSGCGWMGSTRASDLRSMTRRAWSARPRSVVWVELTVECRHENAGSVECLTFADGSRAIMIVGTRQITRWAQLLLFADGHLHALRSDPLAQLCGTRARFMELAAGRMQPGDGRFSDTALITGVFSVVHVLFGGAIEDIVSKLPIHVDIRRALLERHGQLGRLLNATKAAESGEFMAIRAACDELPVFSPNDLTTIGLAAAAWYDDHVRGHRSK
jgi:hypothetical protein